MKRTHPGGPRATWMDSEADQQDRKQRDQGALKSQKSALLGSHSHCMTAFCRYLSILICIGKVSAY
jgi:hypothetical protein